MDAAHRGHGDHLLDANVLQRPEIGPVIDIVRRDGVAGAVAGQKDHLRAADLAVDERAGRLPIGRVQYLAALDFQIFQAGEAGAPDDGEFGHL